jgi:hypothetical protein
MNIHSMHFLIMSIITIVSLRSAEARSVVFSGRKGSWIRRRRNVEEDNDSVVSLITRTAGALIVEEVLEQSFAVREKLITIVISECHQRPPNDDTIATTHRHEVQGVGGGQKPHSTYCQLKRDRSEAVKSVNFLTDT